MPRERLLLKREHKGDVNINIAEIFRNEEMQKEAIKGCKKLKSRKRKLGVRKCLHPYNNLVRNANGLFCNKCNQQISNDPNIY